MREDQVLSGAHFLKHPKVQNAPLSQRITFLEKKGLTQEEIAEALNRVKQATNSGEAGLDQLYTSGGVTEGDDDKGLASAPTIGGHGTSRDAPYDHISPHQFSRGSHMALVPGALLAGVAVGAGGACLYRSLRDSLWTPSEMGQLTVGEERDEREVFLPMDRQLEGGDLLGGDKEGEDVRSGRREPLLELARAIETQAQALTALAEASERSRQELHTAFSTQVVTHTSEIRSELATIKQMLLLNKTPLLTELGGGSTRIDRSSRLALLPAPSSTSTDEANGGYCPSSSSMATGADSASAPLEGAMRGGGDKGVVETLEDKSQGGPAEPLEVVTSPSSSSSSVSLAVKLSAMRGAVQAMLDQNACEDVQTAADMLLIYISNLIRYPKVPRFRRIALVNQGYKERVAKIEGHKVFLKAVGFSDGSSCFEWEWHAAEGQEARDNMTVLQAAITVLTSVKHGGVVEPATAPTPPLLSSRVAPQSVSTEVSTTTRGDAVAEADRSRDPSSTHLDPYCPLLPPLSCESSGLLPALSSSSSSSLSSGAMDPSSPARCAPEGGAPAPSPGAPTKAAAGPAGAADEPGSTVASVSTPASSSSSSSSEGQEQAEDEKKKEPSAEEAATGPQYPKSFMEIMRMTERGETPAGIQQVENRLSRDSDQHLKEHIVVVGQQQQPPPHKPWDDVRRVEQEPMMSVGASSDHVVLRAPSLEEGAAPVSMTTA